MKALMNWPSTSGAMRSISIPSAARNSRISHIINASRLNSHVGETGLFELFPVLGFEHRPGDAPHPEFDAPPRKRRSGDFQLRLNLTFRPDGALKSSSRIRNRRSALM